MADVHLLVIVVAAAIAIVGSLYVWSSFRYSIEGRYLVIRWLILGGIPFNRKCIALERVKEIREFELRRDLLPGFEIWGTLFRGNKMVLVLSSGLFRKLYVTPKEPEAFTREILKSQSAAS